jgi:hypothetical protein
MLANDHGATGGEGLVEAIEVTTFDANANEAWEADVIGGHGVGLLVALIGPALYLDRGGWQVVQSQNAGALPPARVPLD